MKEIYYLDQDKNSRELIIYGVENCGMKCRGFQYEESFFHAVSEGSPSLILIDICLREGNGLDILRRLKKDPRTSQIPIIIVSSRSDEYDIITALDMGADDYVTKPFGILELISRIRAVLRRSRVDCNDLIRIGDLVVDRTSHRVYADGKEIALANREYQLLVYLMENEGVLIPRDTILNHVWGYDFRAETRTVDVHIRYLRQKLGNFGDLIDTVRGVGYRIGRKR